MVMFPDISLELIRTGYVDFCAARHARERKIELPRQATFSSV